MPPSAQTGLRKARTRPERELRNAIIALLRVHGIAAWATGAGAFTKTYLNKRGQSEQRFIRMGTVGMSDIIGCDSKMEGRMIAIEVKSPAGKVSPEQTAFLQTVVRAGGIGFVARSCEDVINKLELKR